MNKVKIKIMNSMNNQYKDEEGEEKGDIALSYISGKNLCTYYGALYATSFSVLSECQKIRIIPAELKVCTKLLSSLLVFYYLLVRDVTNLNTSK